MTLTPKLLESLLNDNNNDKPDDINNITKLLEQRDLIREKSRGEIANRKIKHLKERATGLNIPKLDTQLTTDSLELQRKILECYKTDKVLDCHSLVREYSNLKDKSLKEFIRSA
jgi:hypothetical protein